jgi:hypothetical protein
MWGVFATSSFTANPLRLSKQHLLPTTAEKSSLIQEIGNLSIT